MAHFLVEYREAGQLDLREQKRPDHIAYRKSFGPAMPLAGPLLDESGSPLGSVVILEASDPDAAEAAARADPYIAAGVFVLVSVRRFRIASMKPPEGN